MLLSALAALLAAPGQASAQIVSGPLDIHLEIARSCLFSLEHDADPDGALALLHCTPGTDYQLEIDGGLHTGADGVRHVAQEAADIGAARIAYRLFGDRARRTPLYAGAAVSGVAPSVQPILAHIEPRDLFATAGPYSDLLQVTVSW